MSKAAERFSAAWLATLNQGAAVEFHHAGGEVPLGLHTAIADDFMGELGFKRIGFNWELLDAAPEADGPRSAEHQLVEALSKDISNPSCPWLPLGEAERCARDLLSLFDPDTRTLVSNRYDGLWNPVSGAANEWAFVAFDSKLKALLLIAER